MYLCVCLCSVLCAKMASAQFAQFKKNNIQLICAPLRDVGDLIIMAFTDANNENNHHMC